MYYAELKLSKRGGAWYFEEVDIASAWQQQYQQAIADPKDRVRQGYARQARQDELKQAFMVRHELSVSSAQQCRIHKLLIPNAKSCATEYDCAVVRAHGGALGWFDHTELFYRFPTKNYVLVTQPYDVSLEKYRSLERFCIDHGLWLEIQYRNAWWYPGRCPLIAIFGKQRG